MDQAQPPQLSARLDRDYRDAMKARDNRRLSALRMVRAAVQLTEKGHGRPLTEDELVSVLAREVKLRRESIAEFDKGGRPDLVATENAALSVLLDYLPQQVPDDELREVVMRAIEGLGHDARVDPKRGLAMIMRDVMPRVRGRAEGDRVRALATRLLNESKSA